MIRNQDLALNLVIAIAGYYGVLVLGEFWHVSIDGTSFWHSADDHMITQRVAYNVWQTGLPYFNAGEAVAASTSLFWPIILSPLYGFFSVQNAVAAAIIISAVLYAATMCLVLGQLKGLVHKIGLGAFLVLAPASISYASTAWEHIPQMFCITLAFVLVLHRSQKTGAFSFPTVSLLLICLSFWLRIDSAPTILVAGLVWLYSDQRYRRKQSYFVGLLVLIPAIYFWAMYAFYEDFVPNTAYLKVIPFPERIAHGVDYILDLKRSGWVPLITLFLCLFWKWLDVAHRIILTAALTHIVYVIFIGGDVFHDGRFFLIYFPIISLLLVGLVPPILTHVGRKVGWMAWGGVVIMMLGLPFGVPFVLKTGHDEHVNLISQVHLGKIVSQQLSPQNGSVGLHHLGMGYHMPQFHIVDFLGKAEKHIARSEPHPGWIGHNKWDYEYAFSTYDIAAAPMLVSVYETVISPDFVPRTRGQLFWELSTMKMAFSGNYTFLTPAKLGMPEAMTFGLFVRNDLVSKICKGICQ